MAETRNVPGIGADGGCYPGVAPGVVVALFSASRTPPDFGKGRWGQRCHNASRPSLAKAPSAHGRRRAGLYPHWTSEALTLGGTLFANPELLFDVRPIDPLEHQIQEWGWAACLRPRRNNAPQASVEPRKAEAAIPSQR